MAANSLLFASMEASVRASSFLRPLAAYTQALAASEHTHYWQGATAHWGQVEAAI